MTNKTSPTLNSHHVGILVLCFLQHYHHRTKKLYKHLILNDFHRKYIQHYFDDKEAKKYRRGGAWSTVTEREYFFLSFFNDSLSLHHFPDHILLLNGGESNNLSFLLLGNFSLARNLQLVNEISMVVTALALICQFKEFCIKRTNPIWWLWIQTYWKMGKKSLIVFY